MKNTKYKMSEKFDINKVKDSCINVDETGIKEILIPTDDMVWSFPFELVEVLRELTGTLGIKKVDAKTEKKVDTSPSGKVCTGLSEELLLKTVALSNGEKYKDL